MVSPFKFQAPFTSESVVLVYVERGGCGHKRMYKNNVMNICWDTKTAVEIRLEP